MRYRCGACTAEQWRGLFPESKFGLRHTVIHGVALGVCGIATRLLLARFGATTDGWAGLGVRAVLLGGFYLVAVVVETVGVTAGCHCRSCGVRGLHPA